jgi:hypothetical protein
MNLVNTMNNSDENIKQIINLMQLDDSVDAPKDAIKWSKNIFRSRVVEPKKSIIEQVLAVLKVDLSPNQTVSGERSASASPTRQMLFEADDSSIDLRISATDKGFTIKGQILGEGFEDATVKIGELETKTNDLSEFEFSHVASGNYDLSIKTDHQEIVLKAIEID